MKKSIFQNYYYFWCCCCSVAKLCPTLCNPMRCSTRLPCPSLSPGVFSSSCPLSRWCYLTISSSVALFSFCVQSFPALESFPMSWFFVSGSQSIGASASAPVLPMNIQGWFPLGLTNLVSEFQRLPVSLTIRTIMQVKRKWAHISLFFL